jgi:hypothetical protein
VRRAANRKSTWTLPELLPTVPVLIADGDALKLSASVNTEAAADFANAGRWHSLSPQAPGMWFQIELPSATTVAEVQLDATVPTGRGNAGLGGFGGLGVTNPNSQTPRPPSAPARGAAPATGGRGGAARGAQTQPLSPSSGPVAYSVQVSTDGATWSQPVAVGAGSTPTTVIPIRPTLAKVIRITQTGTSPVGDAWAVQAVRVYEMRR